MEPIHLLVTRDHLADPAERMRQLDRHFARQHAAREMRRERRRRHREWFGGLRPRRDSDVALRPVVEPA